MTKRIVLDLNRCEECEDCCVKCDYFYRAEGSDHGVLSLKERATFQVVCRRCEHASCIAACPCDALERQPDGAIQRWNLRCVSCKLCTQACPFGTIYPELVGFYVTPCDYCLKQHPDQEPRCVSSCKHDAISYREVSADEKEVRLLDDHLAVIGPAWERTDV